VALREKTGFTRQSNLVIFIEFMDSDGIGAARLYAQIAQGALILLFLNNHWFVILLIEDVHRADLQAPATCLDSQTL